MEPTLLSAHIGAGGDPDEREVGARGVMGRGCVTLPVGRIAVPGPRDDRFLLIGYPPSGPQPIPHVPHGAKRSHPHVPSLHVPVPLAAESGNGAR
jgi:hypothetical protein